MTVLAAPKNFITFALRPLPRDGAAAAAAAVLSKAEELGSASTAAAAAAAPTAPAASPAAPAESETATGSAAAGGSKGLLFEQPQALTAAAGAQQVQGDARACRLLSLTCEEAAAEGLGAGDGGGGGGGGGGTMQLVLELTGSHVHVAASSERPNPYSRPRLDATPLPPNRKATLAPWPSPHTSPAPRA